MPATSPGYASITVSSCTGAISARHSIAGLFGRYSRGSFWPQWPAGYVTNLQVDPAWRGRGVGRALMAEVERWAGAEGLELLHLRPSTQSVEFDERVEFRRARGAMELDLAD